MRYFLSIRPWAALGVLAVLGAAILGVFVLLGSRDSGVTGEPIPHRVELVAVVTAVQAAENWSVVNGKTVGEAVLALDDGRAVRITGDTIGEISCTDFSSPNACVLLADVLGPAVVWFAFVPADERNGDEVLTLPALVDMLDGGDLGVTSNGWVVRLTTGVERTCDTETVSLRDFINKFSPDASVTVLDLNRDEVTEVICRQ